MFEIIPGEGLGPLRFGMGPIEIERILGNKEDQSEYDDVVELYFSNYMNLSFRNDKLFQIGATRRSSGIAYKGMDIFSADPMAVLRALEMDAGGAFESYGFIVFPKMGLSLTGFHDDDLDNKAMALSVLEEWQSSSDTLKSISFL